MDFDHQSLLSYQPHSTEPHIFPSPLPIFMFVVHSVCVCAFIQAGWLTNGFNTKG